MAGTFPFEEPAKPEAGEFGLLVREPAEAAGRRIASICGERIARCTLEPGGKSAAGRTAYPTGTSPAAPGLAGIRRPGY